MGVPVACLAALLMTVAAGCFEEKSFPMRSGDMVRIAEPPELAAGDGGGESTRQWLVRAQRELEGLLPPRGRRVLTTDQMVDAQGRAIDVYAYMHKRKDKLNNIFKNFNALAHSSQAAAPGYAIDTPAPPWPGFQTVSIPVADEVQLSGRLGLAESDGQVRQADCIVLLPGIWGDNGVLRTRDLALGLREAGFHVLALELRGHGQTEARYPEVHFTFGVLEAQDLVKVSEWLEDNYRAIRRTGLIGFCWGSNIALLAAWFESCGGRQPSITAELARHLDPVSPRPHFSAGVMAFSTVLDWEVIVDQADRPHSKWLDPSVYALQEVLKDQMRLKAHPETTGNLRRLIDYEFAHSPLTSWFSTTSAYRFLRFVSYCNLPWDDRLSTVRVPVLLVHAVNDPFTMAQCVADLMATSENPNVAALILRGGGHIGFFPYNRAYTYRLILNFFDPQVGAAACQSYRPSSTSGVKESTNHTE